MKEFQFGEMALTVTPTREEMGAVAEEEATAYIIKLLKEKESLRCVFAAAPSQNDFLMRFFADERVDFSRIEAFHMDEYIGLDENDPRTFRAYLKQYFDKRRLLDVHYMNGRNEPDAEIADYSAKLLEKPIDIVFMGIGENGHIAFNDPGVADFADPAVMKVARLDDVCRLQQVHDGCFAEIGLVPQYALTLTIPTLMSAEKIFCIVPTGHKAEALKHAALDPVSPAFPATILRTKKGARVYADQDCFSLLESAMRKGSDHANNKN